MPKNKTPLDKFAKLLENPSPNLSVEVYTENKDERKPVKKPKDERMTLAKLSTRIDDLSMTADNLTMTVNNLSMTVNSLAEEMRNGFKQVNTRIDGIDARLDYNGLKKLPRSR